MGFRRRHVSRSYVGRELAPRRDESRRGALAGPGAQVRGWRDAPGTARPGHSLGPHRGLGAVSARDGAPWDSAGLCRPRKHSGAELTPGHHLQSTMPPVLRVPRSRRNQGPRAQLPAMRGVHSPAGGRGDASPAPRASRSGEHFRSPEPPRGREEAALWGEARSRPTPPEGSQPRQDYVAGPPQMDQVRRDPEEIHRKMAEN